MSSKDKEKTGGRFSNQLSSLAGRPAAAETPSAPQVPATREVPATPEDDAQEKFSTYMTRGRRRRLKLAATVEGESIQELLGRLVEEYLKTNHPDLK